jgi:hypothetical protein
MELPLQGRGLKLECPMGHLFDRFRLESRLYDRNLWKKWKIEKGIKVLTCALSSLHFSSFCWLRKAMLAETSQRVSQPLHLMRLARILENDPSAVRGGRECGPFARRYGPLCRCDDVRRRGFLSKSHSAGLCIPVYHNEWTAMTKLKQSFINNAFNFV